MQMTVYILAAVLHGAPVDMATFAELKNCNEAAGDYKSARCRPADAEARLYGTCWSCMHGCTWQQNITLCGSDPRPTDH